MQVEGKGAIPALLAKGRLQDLGSHAEYHLAHCYYIAALTTLLHHHLLVSPSYDT